MQIITDREAAQNMNARHRLRLELNNETQRINNSVQRMNKMIRGMVVKETNLLACKFPLSDFAAEAKRHTRLDRRW